MQDTTVFPESIPPSQYVAADCERPATAESKDEVEIPRLIGARRGWPRRSSNRLSPLPGPTPPSGGSFLQRWFPLRKSKEETKRVPPRFLVATIPFRASDSTTVWIEKSGAQGAERFRPDRFPRGARSE